MFEQINSESSLNEDNDMNSKREMMFKTHYPSMFKFETQKPSKSSKKGKNNIGIINNKLNHDNNYLGNSLYNSIKKNKGKEELFKSTSNNFGQKLSNIIKNDDDLLDKKKEFEKYKRNERSSKSIKKRKNKSINYYQDKEESKSDDSQINKEKETEKNYYNNNINNKNKEYIGEKILINIKNIIINKFKE